MLISKHSVHEIQVLFICVVWFKFEMKIAKLQGSVVFSIGLVQFRVWNVTLRLVDKQISPQRQRYFAAAIAMHNMGKGVDFAPCLVVGGGIYRAGVKQRSRCSWNHWSSNTQWAYYFVVSDSQCTGPYPPIYSTLGRADTFRYLTVTMYFQCLYCTAWKVVPPGDGKLRICVCVLGCALSEEKLCMDFLSNM